MRVRVFRRANGDHTEHSLDPARLRQAISQSAEELSCRPVVVLLLPVPDVLMIRGGLLVNAATLHTAERLCTRLGVDHVRRWAMSPFGGIADAEVWDQANPHVFLSPGQPASSRQAVSAALSAGVSHLLAADDALVQGRWGAHITLCGLEMRPRSHLSRVPAAEDDDHLRFDSFRYCPECGGEAAR